VHIKRVSGQPSCQSSTLLSPFVTPPLVWSQRADDLGGAKLLVGAPVLVIISSAAIQTSLSRAAWAVCLAGLAVVTVRRDKKGAHLIARPQVEPPHSLAGWRSAGRRLFRKTGTSSNNNNKPTANNKIEPSLFYCLLTPSSSTCAS